MRLGHIFLGAVLVFLYTPILVLMAMGFNASPLYQLPFQFSTRWYGDLMGNEGLLTAGFNSIVLGVITALVATTLGTLAALALNRHSFRGRSLLQLLLLPPIAIPWLITGTAMLIFFFWTGIGRGMHALVIGHVALAVPYVVLVVGTGLKTIRTDLEEAAMSLGSTPVHAFFAVTLPLLFPSILGAALFAFAVSLDQFVVSYFLSSPGYVTLPVQIYSAIRKGFTPEINAISTLLLLGSMSVILIFARFARPQSPGASK
ncbi:ABC transporter permease [Rhodobacter sp. KR11]|jgi:ABC-type spermidine/putrescine transport system permease subunit II|uniref:ABC transporter permease n=1 Tax=Rhodobacter sp. KR11 TaxID=2974588 RepID=UPI002222909B|nr:ABC transporter permease [Rhodobacter sp. KR11]MCW1920287.1 ABC transporter permease [Rhodobacter sp. KR11]